MTWYTLIPCISSDPRSFSQCFRLHVSEPGNLGLQIETCSFTNGWNGSSNNLSAVIPCISSDLGSFSQCFRLWVLEPGNLGLQIETLLLYQLIEGVKKQPVHSHSMHQQ